MKSRRTFRIMAAISVLLALGGCVVVPAYGPYRPFRPHYYYYW